MAEETTDVVEEPTGLMAEHKAAQDDTEETTDTSTGIHFDSKPEYLDPQFFNEETGLVDLEAMQKSQRDFRNKARQAAQDSGVPESADAYTFESTIDIPDDDPLIAASKAAALKHGLSEDAYKGFMSDIFSEISELNNAAGYDAAAEMEALGPNADRRIQDLSDQIDGLVDIGLLGEADYNALIDASSTAAGVVALSKVLNHYQSKPSIPTKTAVAEGMMSKDELDAMVGTDRYNNDPAFRKKVSDGYKKLYGER